MRSARWCVLALWLALSACEENETAVADPEPLAPVEVTADGDGEPASTHTLGNAAGAAGS